MIVGVSMVRNEADVIEATLRHLVAEGVDWLIVADNLSTDDTPEILDRLVGELPLTVTVDAEPAYYQAQKMTDLARWAAEDGARWVLPFDADEIWYGRQGTISETLTRQRCDVIEAHGWDHIRRHDDPAGHPFRTMCYRRVNVQPFPKVAFRPVREFEIAQGNHAVMMEGQRETFPLAYRHFQYRTFEQYREKVRHGKHAYDLTDLDAGQGAHWRQAGALSDDELADEWDALCATDGLVFDPAPLRA